MPIKPGSKTKGARRRSRRADAMQIAPAASPVVRAILTEVERSRMSFTELERRAGPSRLTLYQWARGASAKLHNLEAVCQVMGLRLVVERSNG